MSDKLKVVYTVLVLAALVYAERRLIEPRLTGTRLSALVQEALVYKVLVYQEWHRSGAGLLKKNTQEWEIRFMEVSFSLTW